jgi:hypothetical protein
MIKMIVIGSDEGNVQVQMTSNEFGRAIKAYIKIACKDQPDIIAEITPELTYSLYKCLKEICI